MGDEISFLITILFGESLLRCALKVQKDELTDDCQENPLEPENKLKLHSLLPEHVRNLGPVVWVEPLFEICCL